MIMRKHKLPAFPVLLDDGRISSSLLNCKFNKQKKKEEFYYYIAMEKLGPNLGFLATAINQRFSLKTVA
jgi:hypothetical protein